MAFLSFIALLIPLLEPIVNAYRADAAIFSILFFSDIKMPGMDGFELYTEIRRKDEKVKVCVLTASELYYKEFRMKEYSALDKSLFIRKPIGNEEMLKEIYRLIKR